MSQLAKDIQLSKALSWILRHNAAKEGVQISTEGYVKISDILNHNTFRGKFTIDDITRVVENNDKKRFTIRKNRDGILEICANQGHSIKEVGETNLTPIITPGNFEVIHGTFLKNWQSIKIQGLSCMKRNHVHFASGLAGDKGVISGMRPNCEVFVYINLPLALSDDIKFYKSANSVILSPGDSLGFIKPKYFLKVVDVNGRNLMI